jgi:hypothetical protein
MEPTLLLAVALTVSSVSERLEGDLVVSCQQEWEELALRQTLSDAITYCRGHDAIDESDSLSRLRRQTVWDWQEGARQAGNARPCYVSLPAVA